MNVALQFARPGFESEQDPEQRRLRLAHAAHQPQGDHQSRRDGHDNPKATRREAWGEGPVAVNFLLMMVQGGTACVDPGLMIVFTVEIVMEVYLDHPVSRQYRASHRKL